MILFNQNDYEDGRKRVNGDNLFKLFCKVLRHNGINTDEKVCKHVLINLLTELCYELYDAPEQYIDLGTFVLYRSENLHNLLTVQAKDGENAASIVKHVRNGGLYSEDLTDIVTDFVKDLSMSALEEQQKAAQKVQELNELSAKARKRRIKEHKEKNYGV